MALPWVRLETAFPTNPKILGLIADKRHPAIVAYVCGLSYCGAQGLDGFLPTTCLPFIHANKRIAEQLSSADFDDTLADFRCACGWPKRPGTHTATACETRGAA